MNDNPLKSAPLGKRSHYETHYNRNLLFSIARKSTRDSLDLPSDGLPFSGYDVWNAYELSWLNPTGKPVVAVAQLVIPCQSPLLIESKSLKLYLNSFNQSVFNSADNVQHTIKNDVSAVLEIEITVQLYSLETCNQFEIQNPKGKCLDGLAVNIDHYQPTPALLQCSANQTCSERLYSNLLKSNCPVTGQPDWATLVIEYQGPAINHPSLLKYICSFRQHQGFHEHCIEKIFVDLFTHCNLNQLTVCGHYLRRGGLDINPWRTNNKHFCGIKRLLRQ